ncbi:hypothetical protein CMUS01_14596 [Colletotrichum musicola]|uniref:N-acetyltransferase domain-containing protein n=1 Tax=Colletotrichum musicola TaxID=2175873 RepID=A0A8H6MQS2_9PEZI|nr:hypothetical protein CMUS01_14596 [Colletotrichum musicola]
MASTPDIIIRPATEADADGIARVHHLALAQFDDFGAAWFERRPRDILPLSTRAALQASKNRFLIAVIPASDDVVGFVRYHVVDAAESTPAVQPTADALEVPEKPDTIAALFAIKDHMKELWERFVHPREDEMDACYEKAVDGRRHNYVKHIMVDPDHQRKGIGAKLLRMVVKTSDEQKVPTFLVASAEGYGLYKRLGFEDLGTWTIDDDFWSKEIVEHERKLGISGNEKLAEQYEGVREIERYMIRECRGSE